MKDRVDSDQSDHCVQDEIHHHQNHGDTDGLFEAFDKAGLLENVKHSNDLDKPRFVPRVLFDGADSIGALKQYGVLNSGDAATLGIGAMSDARWKDFFDEIFGAGTGNSTRGQSRDGRRVPPGSHEEAERVRNGTTIRGR